MPSSHLILCRPLLLLPQSLPASESFPRSQFFALGGKSTGASALASVPPMNTRDWFHLGWTVWISLQSKGLSRVFSNTTVQKHQFFGESRKIKSDTVSPSICHEVMGPDAMTLVFWMLSFKPAFFHSLLSPSSKGSFVPLHFLPLDWYHLHIWGWYFSQQS